MKAAIYARVSTDEQTVDNQLPACRAWAESHGAEVVEVFSENESAWRAGHQRELARLLDDLRSGRRKYDVLVVWALDRLTRQGIAAILQLVNSLKVYDCRVVSIQESWTDAPGPMLELFYAVAGWSAKYESDRRSERVKAGKARAIRQGKKQGRPAGSRDKGPRRKSGYYNRWMKRSKQIPADLRHAPAMPLVEGK